MIKTMPSCPVQKTSIPGGNAVGDAGRADGSQAQFLLDKILDELLRPSHAKHAGVDAQMVCGSRAPGLGTIVIIVFSAFLVRLVYKLLGFLLVYLKLFGYAAGTQGERCADKDIHTLGKITQDIVCTPSNKDARLIGCQVPDDIALHLEQRVVAQTVVGRQTSVTDKGETHTEQPPKRL